VLKQTHGNSCFRSTYLEKLQNYESENYLVGGFNPFEKYARQIGSFPQVGVKKNI